MRSSTNAYLSALAMVDLLYLVCAFWLSLRHYPGLKETPFMDNFYSYMFPYSLYLTDAASTYASLRRIDARSERLKQCVRDRHTKHWHPYSCRSKRYRQRRIFLVLLFREKKASEWLVSRAKKQTSRGKRLVYSNASGSRTGEHFH